MYTLNLDENNYVLSIAHTPHDDVALDLSEVELKYLNAYQYISGQLILDPVRKAEIIAEEEERRRKEEEPSRDDRLEAQTLYTAMMTDTLLEE